MQLATLAVRPYKSVQAICVTDASRAAEECTSTDERAVPVRAVHQHTSMSSVVRARLTDIAFSSVGYHSRPLYIPALVA